MVAVTKHEGTRILVENSDGTFHFLAGVSGSLNLSAGTNNIGDVDVLTLPALVAGTANIGDVDVLTLPALPAGTNNIGDVDVLTMPALNAAGVTVFASAARSATIDSADFVNSNGRGLHLVIDITAVAGDDTFTFTIQGKDEVSGKYYTILSGAALGAVATTVMRVYPGLTSAANVEENDILPRVWRLRAVYTQVTGVADTLTFSVGASVIA